MNTSSWLTQLGAGLLVLATLCIAGGLVFFRHPRRLRLFQVAFITSLGSGWLALVVSNAIGGSAIDFSRHLTWFGRDDDPIKYWVSIAFHVSLCLALLFGAIKVARMPIGAPIAGLASGDLTEGFLSFLRWTLLVLAIAVAAVWFNAVWRP